jgi:hypothetical protein
MKENDMSNTSRTSQLRANLGSTRDEMQAFVASLKGRSVSEAMGAMSQSHLVKAMMLSVIVQVVLLLATAIPGALRSPVEAAATTQPVQLPAVTATAPSVTAAPGGAKPAPANRPAPSPVKTSPQKRPAASMDDLDIDRLIN